jgi:hypothetical protein
MQPIEVPLTPFNSLEEVVTVDGVVKGSTMISSLAMCVRRMAIISIWQVVRII